MKPTRLDSAMRALSHPARRAIIDRLMSGETRITDLAEPFSMSLNAVSKHIQVLEDAGLIRRTRVWREHRVSLDPQPLDEISAWIEARRTLWQQSLDALGALIEDDGRPPPATG